MSDNTIKISKAAKDLNVGFSKLIDFLRKKDIEVESSPNARISQEQYELLTQAFKSDKDDKAKSSKLTSDRNLKAAKKTERPEVQEIPTVVTPTAGPKIIGMIDLSSKKGKEPNTQPVTEKKPVAEKPDAASAQKKDDVKPVEPQPVKPKTKESAEKPVATKVSETKPKSESAKKSEPKKVVSETKPHNETVKAKEEAKPAVQEEPKPLAESPKQEKPEEVFKLGVPKTNVNINVVGKIDLSSLNQTTRPKKKTKEERKNERIAKEKARHAVSTGNVANKDAAQQTPQQGNSDKKKRRRISAEKVDIEKSGSQIKDFGNQQRNGKKGGADALHRHDGQGGQKEGKGSWKKEKGSRRQFIPEVNEEDVQRQVKETLARLTNKPQNKAAKWRKEKRDDFRNREREAAEAEAEESKVLKLTEFVTANDLAIMMDVPINNVIATCMNLGVMVSINQRLDAETINIVADEFGFKTEYVSAEVVEAINTEQEDSEDDLIPRAPIVTVMGHVDHGKTSLLDYIRKANVIAGEAGGITQHIGAYNVKLSDGRRITFLDTPGHEAFTAMRARGAKVTDLVIIIVAADDSVMPQTVEAINHASAAGVPIIFAINKIDKPGANPDKIKEELANMNYLVEDWGGKYQSQEISAKTGLGIDELMEKVLLEAEMLELKANPNKKASGSIIESSLDKGRGYVATVLVQAGTLHVGDIVLAGTHYGKVKAMFNERNERIKEAGPSVPALILGLDGAPTAGDKFNVMDSDQEAREIANKREQLQRELGLRTQVHLTLEEIGRRRAIGNFKELNIIVKGDVDGSIEALSDSLIKLSTPEVQVNVLHKGVGAISESDVTLAAASDAIIIGFQVRPSVAAKRLAEKEGVEIRLYSIIYAAIEEITQAIEGMLAPELKEEIIGNAEVLQTYHISKVGTIAGGIVRDGKIKRGCKVRVIRDGIVRYTGDLGSLKRFKDDVKEVASGYDCGLSVAGYNDIKEGDIIEAFEEVTVKKSL